MWTYLETFPSCSPPTTPQIHPSIIILPIWDQRNCGMSFGCPHFHLEGLLQMFCFSVLHINNSREGALLKSIDFFSPHLFCFPLLKYILYMLLTLGFFCSFLHTSICSMKAGICVFYSLLYLELLEQILAIVCAQ